MARRVGGPVAVRTASLEGSERHGEGSGMRTPSASRTSMAIAAMAVIVAVVAVMGLPGLSIGQTTGIHGGSPTDVFMRSERFPETCAPIGVNVDSVKIMPLQVEVEVPSHLLVYFSFEWSMLESHEVGQVNPELDGAEAAFIWRFTGNSTGTHIGGTVMSSFPNVDPGAHTVDVFAAVSSVPFGGMRGRLFANMENCVLTVMVLPAAE